MDLQNVWTVATKDFSIFTKKKSIMYSVILFPLFVSIGLPLVIRFAGAKSGGIPTAALPPLLNAFSFFFIIGAASLPVAIASYSLVGEKVEKSLEPLLATPVTDGEILLGKSLAAFLPPLAATYAGSAIFMAFIDRLTYNQLGYLYFPNWNMAVVLLAVAPLACILSVEVNVIISARANDVRTAQQLGGLMLLPFAGIYVAGEIGLISLETNNLLVISAVLLFVDAILFFVSRSTFRREEILTKWK
jgi:ABC-2 type transport system permease protein